MGRRGEGWVVLQFVLLLAIALAPLAQLWPLPFPPWLRVLGVLMMAGGGVFGMAGVLGLGRNLTALPKPVENGTLVTSGVYSRVRHPIYVGLILAALGWAIWSANGLGLGLALVLLLFFDIKSRREERWLLEVYPDYATYQKRVKKLIPWVY